MFTDNCFIFLVIFHRSLQSCPSALPRQQTVFCSWQESNLINLIWIQGRFKITLMVLMDDMSMEWGQISILIFLILHEHSALWTMRVCSHLVSPQSHISIKKELNNQRELFQSVEEIPTVLLLLLKERLSKHRSKILFLLLAPLQKKLRKYTHESGIGSFTEHNVIPKSPK